MKNVQRASPTLRRRRNSGVTRSNDALLTDHAAGSSPAFAPTRPLFTDILALHGKWRAHRPALVCEDGVVSWAAFDAATNRVAHGLRRAGLAPGDRVALVMSNGVAMAEVMMGAAKAGCAVAPLNLTASDATLGGMIADCDARAVVATADQAARLAGVAAVEAASVRLLADAGDALSGWADYARWRDGAPAEPWPRDFGPDTLFSIIYSSGTTGAPKGIAHTHQARLDWAYDLALALRYHTAARALCTLGLYSNIAWVMMLCVWLAGGTLYVTRRFDAGATLAAIARDRITHTAMVPVQYQRLLDHPDAAASDLSTLEAVMSCGSPLHAGLKARVFERLACRVIELYGLTEGVITTLDPEEAEGRLASVGRPPPGVDLAVIDEAGAVLGPGAAGEIVGRSRFLMTGYHNRPDATAEASWRDPHGQVWLRTGDIGVLDADGFLTIVDRKKDMILSGGQNIYPSDLEAVLVGHPDVADAAVIAAPSAEWGETPVAAVELMRGRRASPPDADALRAWANARLGARQRLSAVVIVEALPRNANGKVVKRALRARFADADAGG